jgi:hypothetical protein
MTACWPGSRTVARPSRLARSAPPLRGYGLDCLSPARLVADKRSSPKMSGIAPFATDQARRFPRMLWRKHGPFSLGGVCAILPQCRGTVLHCAIAPHSANCHPIFMSCPVPGRALAGRSNMTSRRGAWWMIGPRACRSHTPKSTFLKPGSAIFSTSYLGHADEVRRHLP